MKKNKLKKILKGISHANDFETTKVFRKVAVKLSKTKMTIKSITEIKEQIQSIFEYIAKLKEDLKESESEKLSKLSSMMVEYKNANLERLGDLSAEMDNVKKDIKEISQYKVEIPNFEKQIIKIENELSEITSNNDLDNTRKKVIDLEEEIKKLRRDTMLVMANRGGSIPFQVNINSSVASTRYADINFQQFGNIGWAAVNDDDNKRVNIRASILSGGGGGGTPGGSDTQVQFNDATAFGGDAGFTYNKTTNIATLGGLFTPAITGGTGLGDDLTLNTTSNAAKGTYYFPDLGVAPGFLKSSGSDGAISIDTNTYLTSNQTITLSGDATGSGTTSIVVTIDHGGLNGLSDDDHCFSEDTEILTNRGFTRYEDIKESEKVLTFNTLTDELEYQKITGKYIYENFKEIISFKNRYGEILVTRKHRMIFRNTTNPKTKNLSKKWFECSAEEAVNKSVFVIPISGNSKGKKLPFSNRFAELLGIIIAEGHFLNPKTSGYGIIIYQMEGKQANYIENLLNEVKIPYTKHKGQTVSFYIRSSWAKKNIRKWIDEKNISEKLMSLRKEQFYWFLSGLILGGGSIRTNHKIKIDKIDALEKLKNNFDKKIRYSYHSGNKELIDNLSHLCVLNGLSAYSYYRKGGFKNGCWTINIKNSKISYFGKNTKTIKPYSGIVWCVSVPNKTLVLRRNGFIFIAGNTQYAYLIGRSGGQTLFGGADAGDDLTFRTANSITKGDYIFADITTDGYAKLGGGAGVLSAQAVPIPIADGGTNSTTALNNSRVMTAVSGAIVESGAITDGESIQRNNTTFISAPLPLNTVEGRLTLTSGTPVTTADVTGATTIYFTPYAGNRIYLYDGTRWKLYSFSELSLALGTLTNALPYDVFMYDNSGTLTLELLAWTNGTTRATALTTQNGVLVKSGATTRRYLGTFYTTSTTTTEDSGTKRFVWNYYNRKLRTGRIIETGDHTYATAAWREYGAGTYRLSGVWGVAESGASFSLRLQCSCGTANKYNFMGIGVNTVTGATTQMGIPIVSTSVSNTKLTNYMTTPALGFNYYAVVENALSAVTITSEEMEITAMWES